MAGLGKSVGWGGGGGGGGAEEDCGGGGGGGACLPTGISIPRKWNWFPPGVRNVFCDMGLVSRFKNKNCVQAEELKNPFTILLERNFPMCYR